MSYRFLAEQVEPIGKKAGVIGTDKIVLIPGREGLRLTIPYLSFRCGATAQSLHSQQVETQSRIETINKDNDKITLEDDLGDLSDRTLIIEKLDGTWLLTTASATEDKTQTLSQDLAALDLMPEGRVYLLGEDSYEHNQEYQLTANEETVLQQPAPGFLIARDFCYPLILSFTNTSNAATLQGGTAVYINR